jgi:hypothetical protein
MARVLVNLCTALGALVLVLGMLGGIWWLLWGERSAWDGMVSPREGEVVLALPLHPYGTDAALVRLDAVSRPFGPQMVGPTTSNGFYAIFPDNADTVIGSPYASTEGMTIALTCRSVTTAQAQARCRTIARAYMGER